MIDDDINSLFRRIGGGVKYKEIRATEDVAEARNRWPLLRHMSQSLESTDRPPESSSSALFHAEQATQGKSISSIFNSTSAAGPVMSRSVSASSSFTESPSKSDRLFSDRNSPGLASSNDEVTGDLQSLFHRLETKRTSPNRPSDAQLTKSIRKPYRK